MGRGPEFDDKVASREHKRAARGELKRRNSRQAAACFIERTAPSKKI